MNHEFEMAFSKNPLQLTATDFGLTGVPKNERSRTVRGKNEGAHDEKIGTFEWRQGVKALCILFLRYKASDLRHDLCDRPILAGTSGSPAKSLDNVLDTSDPPRWVHDMFGEAQILQQDLTGTTRPKGKGKNAPVQIGLAQQGIDLRQVRILLDNELIEDADMLDTMAQEIEADEATWAAENIQEVFPTRPTADPCGGSAEIASTVGPGTAEAGASASPPRTVPREVRDTANPAMATSRSARATSPHRDEVVPITYRRNLQGLLLSEWKTDKYNLGEMAREIDMLGWNLHLMWFGDSEFVKALRKRKVRPQLRILLPAAGSPTLERRAEEYAKLFSEGSIRTRHEETMCTLSELELMPFLRLVHDLTLYSGMVRFDDKMIFTAYLALRRGSNSPAFLLTREDAPDLFRTLCEEFDDLWRRVAPPPRRR